MLHRVVSLVTILLLTLIVSPAAHAQGAPADARPLELFLSQLQRAVGVDDRVAVAAMFRYPITIAIGGFRVPFADATSVVERYDDIFNPPLREAIARAPVATVIGNGNVMIEQVNGQLKITAISVPPFTEDPAAAPPADTPRGNAASKREPRRIAIRIGPRATQVPGTLLRDATDTFLLFLPKGKLASVRLERVPAGAASIRVVHARTGEPLSTRVSADGRFVSGRPAESGDYRVEVRWTATADEGHLPYILSLTLR